MARKSQIKHSIKLPKFNKFYIPPFDDFMEFLQISSGPIAIADILSSHHKITLDVSRSSLGKLNNEGVGATTWNKLVVAVNPLFKQAKISVWAIREAIEFSRIGSNYNSWIGVIKGIKVHHDYNDDVLLYSLVNFLENRSLLQKKATLPIPKKRRDIPISQKTSSYSISYHETEAELYRLHSLIPNKVIDESLPILVKGLSLREISKKDKRKLMRYCFHQQWDFYLSPLVSGLLSPLKIIY